MTGSDFLQTALAASAAAADVARRYFRADPEVWLKADQSPVTIADIECERLIRNTILERYPEHGFLGEESGRSSGGGEYLWLVDPIDGTKGFVRGYPMFSTQIALMHRGRLLLGVSEAPVYGERAWAERGRGAWLDGEQLSVSAISELASCTLSTGNLRRIATGARWAGLGRLVAQVDRIRGYGDFLHYHLLAGGRIDAVVESDVGILDIAALTVIVEEAGGTVSDLDGSPVGLETRSIVATNGLLHATVLEALRG